MSDAKCARMLREAAERDIEALRVMCRADGVPDEIVGFHVQQAAEKLLKAWIALLGESYPLTHNIDALLALLAELGAAVAPFRSLANYTPYAVEFRCAGVGPDAAPLDRRGDLALVEALLDRVKRLIAEAERPRPRAAPPDGRG